MADIQLFPPPPEAAAAMAAVAGIEMAPTMLVNQRGPEGHRGPEEAGAILLLQATFAHEAGAQRFWEATVPLVAQLAEAPGFIRRFSFMADLSITLFAFWRTVEDAERFAASPAHRAASRALFEGRWQHSHFSAIWKLHRNQGRLLFCDDCDGITRAPARACRSCGSPLADVYELTSAKTATS